MKLRVVAALAVAVLSVSACGSRVGGDEVLAGAGGGTVRLDDATIAELRKATAGTGAAPAGMPLEQLSTADETASAPAASASSATAPAAGTATETAAGTATAAKSTAKSPSSKAAAVPAQRPAAAAKASCTTPGAPLKLGQVGAFSGVSGPITANARTAMAAWVQDVNARGGIACHPVQLLVVDDGGDPAKAAALVQQLVREKGVQAIVGVFDPLGFKGVRDAAERLRVPVVGGDGLDVAWNESPYIFPAGAGILGVVRGAIRQARDAKTTNFGLLYCVEAAVCTNVAKIIPPESERAGGKITYSAAISLTQPDFTAQCQAAKNAGVEGLGLAMDGASIARVARSCASIGYHPQLVTNGLVLSAANAADPAIRKNSLSSSSPVAPWMANAQDTPGQREYHAAMAKYAPNAEPTGNSIAAWAAGKLLEAAVGNLGADAAARPVTTADIMTGLGKISKETLGGLTPPITFKPGQKFAPPMDCVYFTLLTEKGWTAPRGSKPVCS
ncbi:MAG: ABC transporter substrate-binding protein [Sporichthyaceae bacterium]